MRQMLIFTLFVLLASTSLFGQEKVVSLQECFEIARQNNAHIQQREQSLKTRKYQLQATKLSRLPDVDILAGYTYHSDPVKINLQSVRKGIVEGTAQQNVQAANAVFNEISGHDLSQGAQDAIYSGSKNIIDGLYPNYNPALSRQEYFTAGVALRMPLYLGGKLDATRQVAKARLHSGELNVRFTQNAVAYAVATQYLKILYLNTMLQKQHRLVKAFQETKNYAADLAKNEIIPPYQASWANVALSQAKTGLSTFALEKENALLLLEHIIGNDVNLHISDTLVQAEAPNYLAQGNTFENNPAYQWLQSKTEVAETSVKVARSMSLPNIFGIANYQFLREDLPLITPPWMVGIGLQWNIFSSFKNAKNIKATQSLVEQSKLLAAEKKKELQVKLKIAKNKLIAIQQQVHTLDQARKEAATTTEMIRRRMKNEFSSVKDVNDALQVQLEVEKAYYSSVLAYNMAVATYLKILDNPEKIIDYL